MPRSTSNESQNEIAQENQGRGSNTHEDQQQHHGEHTGAEKIVEGTATSSSSEPQHATTNAATSASSAEPEGAKEQLDKSPGEKAFFKLLHSEFRKATHFFDKAQTEFEIREERVREGMEIMKQPKADTTHQAD